MKKKAKRGSAKLRIRAESVRLLSASDMTKVDGGMECPMCSCDMGANSTCEGSGGTVRTKWGGF